MIQSLPLVSIIMPAYNCEQFVRQAIDMILQQTYTHIELLIADDCSTDNTKYIIDTYTDKRIKIFHNNSNQGYLKATNLLFEKCSGDYITFQDADDYSELNRIELLISFLENNKEYDCAGSNIVRVDSNNVVFSKSDHPLNNDEIKEHFKTTRIVMTGSALCVRKEVVSRIGYYNTYFNRLGSEDVYWFSLILDNYKVANLSQALYYYRDNQNSVSLSFKNPKTAVLHNLIVQLYNRRAVGMEDYLQTHNIKNIDAMCEFLIALKIASSLKALLKYCSLSLRFPAIGCLYFREFMFKVFKKKKSS